ncbi:hypothetical protein [Streptomyces sp. NRRL F-6674]|uniref:hypothetical protein n=1 Tax=Streptomyces sp. NRRL F-6674 TaxID=1463877 RepID=UPI0005244F7A|nr:hypothetical protein [Streptomyces sp. NRRL F-6674]
MDIFVIIVYAGVLLFLAAMVLFVILVIAIRRDDKRYLPAKATTPTGVMSRRVLGTYSRHNHRNSRAGVIN